MISVIHLSIIQNHDYFSYPGFPIIISYLSIPFDSSQEEIKLLKHRQDEFIEEAKEYRETDFKVINQDNYIN